MTSHVHLERDNLDKIFVQSVRTELSMITHFKGNLQILNLGLMIVVLIALLVHLLMTILQLSINALAAPQVSTNLIMEEANALNVLLDTINQTFNKHYACHVILVDTVMLLVLQTVGSHLVLLELTTALKEIQLNPLVFHVILEHIPTGLEWIHVFIALQVNMQV